MIKPSDVSLNKLFDRFFLFAVLKAAALMNQPAGEGAELRPAAEEVRLAEQQLGLRQVEERLHRDHIHRLVKQSPEYPNYQYLCKLCSVHIDNIQGAYKHIKEKRHKKNLVEKQEENELLAIPPPSAAQLRALDAAVLETARQHGISEEDFEVRRAVVSRMEETIKRNLPGWMLPRLFTLIVSEILLISGLFFCDVWFSSVFPSSLRFMSDPLCFQNERYQHRCHLPLHSQSASPVPHDIHVFGSFNTL
uniref:Terminal uridylyltransferase 4/7 nucleotidyltransferase domain-containing protein n=1 Tax=Kryptolebias marmoratus TaxID=37003 RepID=A0A3Q3B5J2_KRYMA